MAAMKGRETRPTKGPDHERLSPLVSADAVYGEPGRHQLYDNVLRPSGLRVTQFSATRPGRSPLRPRRLRPVAVCRRSTIPSTPSASPPRMVRADSAAVALCRKQARPFFPLTKPASEARTSSARRLKLGCGPARWRSGFSCWPREATRRTTSPPCGLRVGPWSSWASGSHGHLPDERGRRAAPDLRPHQQNGRH